MKKISIAVSLVLFLVVGLFAVYNNTANADTCVQSLPSVNIFPNNQKGVAGQALPYVIVITNNDSSGCGNTTFTVQGQVNSVGGDDSGFTSSASTVTLAPGASDTTSVSITSPANPTENTYWVFIYAQDSNSANATHYNLSLALYNIDKNPTGCTRVTPTISTFPVSATGRAGEVLSYKVAVKNNDSKGCIGASTFSISSSVLPAGFSSTSSSLTLAPGEARTTTIKVTASKSAKNNINNFIVTANDKSLSGHKGSILATYIVNNPESGSTSTSLSSSSDSATDTTCAKKAPTVSASSTSKTATAGSTKPFAIKVKIKNNDPKGCAKSSFAVTVTGLPDGATPINKTIKLAAGASGTVTLNISSATSTPGTTNNLVISVSDLVAGEIHNAFAPFSYIVSSSSTTPGATNTSPAPTPTPNPDTPTVTSPVTTATPTVTPTPTSTAPAATVNITSPTSGSTFNPASGNLVINAAVANMFRIIIKYDGVSRASTTTCYVDTCSSTVPSDQLTQGTHTVTVDVYNTSNVMSTDTVTFTVAGSCARSNPTVTVSPSTQNGTVGQALPFTVSVKNNDSTPCTSTTFTLGGYNLPGNWTSTFPTLTVAPGATTSGTVTITSAASTVASNTITFQATDPNISSHYSWGFGTYVVSSSGSTACTRSAPTVTLTSMTPASVSAGLPITYYINVTNNDTGNCSPNTRSFTVTMTTPPGGWNGGGTYGMGALASGASATAKETLTSSAGMANGTYNITFNVGDSISSGSLPATYVINNPPSCTTPYPTISMSPTSNTGVAGSTQSYVVTVKNNDASGCVDTTFNISPRGLPAGFTYTSPTLTLAPGATNTATFTVTSPGNATAGTNSFNVVVYDDALNNHSASVGGNYIVSAVGKAKVSASSLLANVLKSIKKKPAVKKP